ncbi:MAG: hypothetical protein PF689_00105 [Deltaproteobacteria bacterium]|jgi:hypothetical protein|nr:hypothetical protein [Deltaproteobacteria bacterium]
MKFLFFFLLFLPFFSCESPSNLKPEDGSFDELDYHDFDIPDYDYTDLDIRDADIYDSPDSSDATQITEDPHIEFISCDRGQTAFYYPWAYSAHYVLETREDGYKHAYDLSYRFNFITGQEEERINTDKLGYGYYSYLNQSSQKIYNPGRTIKYVNNPADDGVYGDWTLRVTEVDTWNSFEIYQGHQLLSEDCLARQQNQNTGGSILSVWKMADDETTALFACSADFGSDLYHYDFSSGEINYLLRASEEDYKYNHADHGYSMLDYGGDYISYRFNGINWPTNEIRVWNWKTQELVWVMVDPDLANITPKPSSEGWIYYTKVFENNGSYYLKAEGYNFLTGEIREVPQVMENTLAVLPASTQRPELFIFTAGDGPIDSSEPRLPIGNKYYYIWNHESGVVRRLTLLPISYGVGIILPGQNHPQYAVYQMMGGLYPCHYYKDLQAATIIDPQGNLISQ